MGYKLQTTWKGKTVKTSRTFKTRATARKFKEKRLQHLEVLERRAVKYEDKRRLGNVEKAEHAVMRAKIVKVA